VTATTFTSVDDIDLSDPGLWAAPDDVREAAFRRLRADKPVSFHQELVLEGVSTGPGYWALTRFEDIWTASRNAELFISGRGTNIGDIPIELAEFLGSMINMDAPRHSKLRGIVNRGFIPKTVNDLTANVERVASEIVDQVAPLGQCDFVSDIAARLPLRIICDMLGIPVSLHERVFELTNVILGVGDPEYVTSLEDLMSAALELNNVAIELGEARRKDPTDDLTSKIMHAEVEGETLTTTEFGSFFILLVVAGNETTRTAISHGMKALTDFPKQREIWMEDFEGVAPTAVEEIVRWATPVIHFRRTASRDTEVAGVPIAEGDKVVFWYNSANRDEDHWEDPYAFDVRRQPTDHLGFGGGGPHFCLGAHLARREIKVMFEEIFRRLPDLEITGPPDMLISPFIHGIKRMPCAFTPT